jgi:hypothetical protein
MTLDDILDIDVQSTARAMEEKRMPPSLVWLTNAPVVAPTKGTATLASANSTFPHWPTCCSSST